MAHLSAVYPGTFDPITLGHSDLVKFAKLIPDIEKTKSDFDESHQLVNHIMHSELVRIAAEKMELESSSAGEQANV